MELLKRIDSLFERWRSRGVVAWILLAAALFGCSIVGPDEPPDFLGFNHAVHAQQGLTCAFCHPYEPTKGRPGQPQKDDCLACHARGEYADEVEEFFEGWSLRRKEAALADEVIFAHTVHEEAIEDCGVCHRGIRTSERAGPELRLDMDDCMECHEAAGQPNDCSTCHAEIDIDWAPENHARLWDLRHGSAARARSLRPNENCALCHTEDTCIECHLSEEPRSHTEFFRLRGHGLTASMDRQSCAVCHRSDSCDRCHQETRPLSHLASPSFGGARSNHCLSCHFPLRSEGCSVCHLGTPSHDSAPPKPGWHDPAMDCRSCHQMGVMLFHADGGQNCNSCHR